MFRRLFSLLLVLLSAACLVIIFIAPFHGALERETLSPESSNGIIIDDFDYTEPEQ